MGLFVSTVKIIFFYLNFLFVFLYCFDIFILKIKKYYFYIFKNKNYFKKIAVTPPSQTPPRVIYAVDGFGLIYVFQLRTQVKSEKQNRINDTK